MNKCDAEIKSVWVVTGCRDMVDADADAVYTHAFATKAEALEIYRKGKAEIPHVHWEISSMNYGYIDFAQYMLEVLKEDETL
jgi:hypothetical protein